MSAPHAINARVFLLGCSRSGTTVLQRCLANHPDAHSFPETGFFRQLSGNRYWSKLALRGLVRGKCVRKAFGRLASIVPEMNVPQVNPPAITGTPGVVARFVQTMDDHVAGLGKSIWVEKTPKHYQYARIIHRYVPQGLIIHVVRNGQDVVASIRDRAQTYSDRFADQKDPTYGVKEWNQAIRMAWEQRDEPRVQLVLFEDFSSSAEHQLRGLMTWLQLAYAPEMLAAESRDKIRHAHEHWKDSAQNAIHPPASKFCSVFSQKEQDWVNQHLDWETYKKLSNYIQARQVKA